MTLTTRGPERPVWDSGVHLPYACRSLSHACRRLRGVLLTLLVLSL
ncbi:hypothetical protein [Paenibacillus chitinolyticus]|nr:hypothetical protein [Paenibacillus chitinolyticus]